MARQKKFRGVSIGTIVMLLATVAVVLGMAVVLPKLGGNTKVNIDTGKVLQALSFGEGLPELSLSDIPIISVTKHTSEPAKHTQMPVQPTLAPDATLPPAQTAAPTAVPTVQPTATPVPGGRFTATFGGSVIVNSDLRQANYYNESKKYDFSDILSLLKNELTADLSLVTLENIINPEAKLSDTNTSPDVLDMLTAVGFDAVALGYRNAYDQGFDGLNATIQAAQSKGLTTLGAYADQQAADSSHRVVELGGVKVGLAHYTDVLTDKGKSNLKKDGHAFALPLDSVSNGADAVLEDIAALKKQGAEVVIVSLSWSAASGKSTPTKKQTAFAQQLADAGVDVIIGAGSRVIQPVTWLTGHLADGSTKQTLCAYSLGSLLNGSRTNANVAGMLLHLDITYDGQKVVFNKVSYTPTYIWRFKQDGRYYYRVVASDLPAPDGMSESQIESKERALTNAQKYLGSDPVLTLR